MAEIVVGVDESDGAAEAVRWAVREGDLHGWEVVAVMAWGFLDQHYPEPTTSFDPSYGESEATAALDAILANALGSEVAATVTGKVVCDLAPRALVEAARGSALLVVGARGLGGFKGLLLGSVSQHCLHHATSPVAVVRNTDGAVGHDRVVAAVDGSTTADRALAWAAEEARLRAATLRVVHAWHAPLVGGYPYASASFDTGQFEEASREVLEDAIAGSDTSGLAVERVQGQGPATGVILDAASDADLVVMGSRGLSGFAGMILGSVTLQVAQHAPGPVVVVPPERR